MVDATLFLNTLIGELSEARMGIIKRAWLRMDPSRTAAVAFVTVRQFYNPILPGQ